MGQDTDVIALVGAGDQGLEVLRALLRVPGVEVRYVFDPDPAAPGITLARENGIRCRVDGRFDELAGDAEVGLVLVTGGDPDVLAAVEASQAPGQLPARRRRRALRRSPARRDRRRRRAVPTSRRPATCGRPRTRSSRRCPRSRPTSTSSSGATPGRSPSAPVTSSRRSTPAATRPSPPSPSGACWPTCAASTADVLEMSPVHLGEVIDEAVERYAEAAAARDIEIRVLPYDAPDLVRVRPDAAARR